MVSPGTGNPAFSSRSAAPTAQYPYATTAFRNSSRMDWLMRSAFFRSAVVFAGCSRRRPAFCVAPASSPAVTRASRFFVAPASSPAVTRASRFFVAPASSPAVTRASRFFVAPASSPAVTRASRFFVAPASSPAVTRASRPRSRYLHRPLLFSEPNQLPIKFLRTLLIRQMPHSRKHHHLHIREMPRQRRHRRNVHRRILISPHQQCRNRLQLRQYGFQLLQIRRPGLHNAESVLDESRNRQLRLIPLQASLRNLASVGIESPVCVFKNRRHATRHPAKSRRTEPGRKEWSHPLSVWRIRIHRAHQNQLAQLAAIGGNALRCSHHRDRSAPRRSQQVKRFQPQLLGKLQNPPRGSAQGVIEVARPVRKSCPQQIGRVDAGVRS